MVYKVLGFTCLIVYSSATWSLPSFTEKCPADAQVVSPTVPSNGGYKVNRSCDVIYVLPPRTGRFLVEAIAPSATLNFCQSVNSGISQITMLDTAIVKTGQELIDRRAELSAAEKEDLIADIKRYMDLKKATLNDLNKFGPMVALNAQVRFDVEWERLVQSYKEANPTKTVQRVPLVGSILTATLRVPSIMSELSDAATLDALIAAEIPGLVTRPEILNFIDTNNENYGGFTFGESLTGRLKLNLMGACPYWSELSRSIGNGPVDFGALLNSRTNSLAPYMVANLNYFYPVQTQFSYRLHYKVTDVGQLFESLITTQNTFKATAVYNKLVELEKKSKMEIEVDEGIGPSPFGELSVSDIKNDIRLAFVHSVLEKVATPDQGPPTLKEVPLPSDPHYLNFASRYVCESSSRMFGLIKKSKCYSTTYTIKVPTTAIASSAQSIIHDITLNAKEEVKVYKTLIQAGTLGFFEKE